MEQGSRPKVAIGYHFLPHYREAIVHHLASQSTTDFVFVAGLQDPTGGVKSLPLDWLIQEGKFKPAHCFQIGPFFWQPALTWKLLASRSDTWILLSLPTSISVWAAALVGRLLRKRILFWAHGFLRHEKGKRRTLLRTLYSLSHGALLYGHRARDIAIEEGFDAAEQYVVFNSLDHDVQRKLRTSLSDEDRIALRADLFADSNLPLLICTSRLTAVRDLPLAFSAMKKMSEKGQPVNLLLVGDGPERAALESLAKELNLSVCFYGACYDEALLARLLLASDVTVAPGKVGLTAMHSLAYGVPVVTHHDADQQMPEWEAIIDGWNGSTFDRGDPESLANALIRAMALPRDQVRERCFAVIDRFYNPRHQVAVIAAAVRKEPASDKEWSDFLRQAKADIVKTKSEVGV